MSILKESSTQRTIFFRITIYKICTAFQAEIAIVDLASNKKCCTEKYIEVKNIDKLRVDCIYTYYSTLHQLLNSSKTAFNAMQPNHFLFRLTLFLQTFAFKLSKTNQLIKDSTFTHNYAAIIFLQSNSTLLHFSFVAGAFCKSDGARFDLALTLRCHCITFTEECAMESCCRVELHNLVGEKLFKSNGHSRQRLSMEVTLSQFNYL